MTSLVGAIGGILLAANCIVGGFLLTRSDRGRGAIDELEMLLWYCSGRRLPRHRRRLADRMANLKRASMRSSGLHLGEPKSKSRLK